MYIYMYMCVHVPCIYKRRRASIPACLSGRNGYFPSWSRRLGRARTEPKNVKPFAKHFAKLFPKVLKPIAKTKSQTNMLRRCFPP